MVRLTQLYPLDRGLHLTTEGQREMAGPVSHHHTEGLEALGGMYQRVGWCFIGHTFYQTTSKLSSFRACSLARGILYPLLGSRPNCPIYRQRDTWWPPTDWLGLSSEPQTYRYLLGESQVTQLCRVQPDVCICMCVHKCVQVCVQVYVQIVCMHRRVYMQLEPEAESESSLIALHLSFLAVPRVY